MRVALVALACAAACAQTSAKHEFEAASIKVNGAWNGVPVQRDGGPGTSDPGRIHYSNWSLRMLTAKAYGTKGPYQLSTPDWMANEFYTLDATLPPDATAAEFALMLQNLLATRFHVVTHRESKEMAGYALAIDRSGIKMKAAAPAAPGEATAGPEELHSDRDGWTDLPPGHPRAVIAGSHGLLRMTARMEGSDFLREFLEGYLKRPVVDETGLTGAYDFRLEYARETPPAPSLSPESKAGKAHADVPEASGVPLPAAIQKQLGLRLEAKKIIMDVLVVDRADKTPTEN